MLNDWYKTSMHSWYTCEQACFKACGVGWMKMKNEKIFQLISDMTKSLFRSRPTFRWISREPKVESKNWNQFQAGHSVGYVYTTAGIHPMPVEEMGKSKGQGVKSQKLAISYEDLTSNSVKIQSKWPKIVGHTSAVARTNSSDHSQVPDKPGESLTLGWWPCTKKVLKILKIGTFSEIFW